MNDTSSSIENFRKINTVAYTSKGVCPPAPNTEEEKMLYEQWLKGKEIIAKF